MSWRRGTTSEPPRAFVICANELSGFLCANRRCSSSGNGSTCRPPTGSSPADGGQHQHATVRHPTVALVLQRPEVRRGRGAPPWRSPSTPSWTRCATAASGSCTASATPQPAAAAASGAPPAPTAARAAAPSPPARPGCPQCRRSPRTARTISSSRRRRGRRSRSAQRVWCARQRQPVGRPEGQRGAQLRLRPHPRAQPSPLFAHHLCATGCARRIDPTESLAAGIAGGSPLAERWAGASPTPGGGVCRLTLRAVDKWRASPDGSVLRPHELQMSMA